MAKVKRQKISFNDSGSIGSLRDAFASAGFETTDTGFDTASADGVDSVRTTDDDAQGENAISARALRVHAEKKGRGGKTVTVIEGVALPDTALKTMVKQLKKSFGCGAFVEGGNIVLQGNIVARVSEWIDSNLSK